jgi:hypothetical protein
MPTVLSLRRCTYSTCTSCICFVLLWLGLCGRFVAAAVGTFGAGCPIQRNGEWFIGGLSPRLGNGPLEFLCMRSALAHGSTRAQIAEQRTLLCPSLTLRRALELTLACTKILHWFDLQIGLGDVKYGVPGVEAFGNKCFQVFRQSQSRQPLLQVAHIECATATVQWCGSGGGRAVSIRRRVYGSGIRSGRPG